MPEPKPLVMENAPPAAPAASTARPAVQTIVWILLALALVALWVDPVTRHILTETASRASARAGHFREGITDTITRWGPAAPIASLLINIAHTFVPFPADVIAAANGAAFGLWKGAAIEWLGVMISSCLGFGIARALGRPVMMRIVPGRWLDPVDRLMASAGWTAPLLLRFVPLLPGDFVTFALGLTSVSWLTFLWTTAAGITPWVVTLAAVGAGLTGGRHLLPYALGGFVFLALISFLLHRHVDASLARSTSQSS
jgi:uncharacterized membrane protein YdjX (TVP38/TMEM64 family)